MKKNEIYMEDIFQPILENCWSTKPKEQIYLKEIFKQQLNSQVAVHCSVFTKDNKTTENQKSRNS